MGAQPCARSRFADVNQELVREMATKTVQLNTLEAALAARKKDADERAAAREAAITEAIRRGEEVDPEGGGGADEEDTVVLQPLPGAGAWPSQAVLPFIKSAVIGSPSLSEVEATILSMIIFSGENNGRIERSCFWNPAILICSTPVHPCTCRLW